MKPHRLARVPTSARFAALAAAVVLLPLGISCYGALGASQGLRRSEREVVAGVEPPSQRLRVIIETDAGGDPDDEQSLVRFLVYASEFDIEGIIANRPIARDRENRNPVRDGLGIVRAQIEAYRKCHANLVQHDPRFPTAEHLLSRTVAGYDDTDAGVKLIVRAVDAEDPRPVWFSNWGTDQGSAESCLKRALDQVLRERGPAGYAAFKSRLRLCSADKFGEHTTTLAPAFPRWVDTFRPTLDNLRWYHRFSRLTATAGEFNLERDVRTGHGPLGALYPTNTGLPQKEGDTMAFLYLVPTGMNDPNEPAWGSWAGRYGPNEECPGKPYFWANQTDTWRGTTSRDHTLARWAADLQNDFRARLDWCVKPREQANHRPIAVLNGRPGSGILRLDTRPGEAIELSAEGSRDPDGDALAYEWLVYGEAGTYPGEIALSATRGLTTRFTAPEVAEPETIHVILRLQDAGQPALCSYRRVIITVAGPATAALQFEKRVLTDKYYCDGINAGDFNRDGHMDVVAGPFWYEGPEFRRTHEIYPPKVFPTPPSPTDSLYSFVHDLNGDGWADVLVVGRVHLHQAFQADGRPDILTVSKLGAFVFFNRTMQP